MATGMTIFKAMAKFDAEHCAVQIAELHLVELTLSNKSMLWVVEVHGGRHAVVIDMDFGDLAVPREKTVEIMILEYIIAIRPSTRTCMSSG